MVELNLKQITDKLNAEFTGDTRKLIFWYDANAEFKDDIDTMELENAKILHLEPDNQFYTKYFLECVDTQTNYLVYAPFAKPDIKENHLTDTILYSKEFFADRASLITLDLGIDEKYKPVIQQYIKFFASKERTQRFYDLEIDNYNKSSIEVALLSVLCKNKTASFEEVLRCVLTDDGLDDNKFLTEFKKYDLLNAFWQQVESAFGYSDAKPTLEKLVMTMFVTYASKRIYAEIPKAWEPFISYKGGSIIVFIDNLMNNILYSERFDEISAAVYRLINADAVFDKMDVQDIAECHLFAGVDKKIVSWLLGRLELEDTGAKMNGKSIPEICRTRRVEHFGKTFSDAYSIIENAFYIIAEGKYQPVSGIMNVINDYLKNNYKTDRRYRYFYYYYDRLENTAPFEKLRELIENIYTNDFLNPVTVNWSREFKVADVGIDKQREFYFRHVKYAKERTVVIISDALRYETAYTLYERLQADEKCDASIIPLLGVLPSYTPLGMAALLPHHKIEYSDNYEVLVDGRKCASTEQRQEILQSHEPNSRCVQFDDIKNMKQADLREIFTGQDTVYIYHNQIDARGDAAKTENEVFNACEEAIEEIHSLIRRISSMANTNHFYVTADHGFIYKRDRLEATDKIKAAPAKTNSIGQRYIISNSAVNAEGVCSIPLSDVLVNDDERVVSFPLASDIFKVAGAGQNYVHGGSSPQELLVPLIEVKVEKGKRQTKYAEIALISLTSKITNLITTLDFIQTEPVSDVVKEARYRIYFVSENNEKISNENICIADKKDKETINRMFRLRFNFKNKRYDKSQKYFLVAYNESNDMEVLRREMTIDIAFADDFGFFN